MIQQLVASILSAPAAYQDFKSQEIDGRLIIALCLLCIAAQLYLGYDTLADFFSIIAFFFLFVLQHFNLIGKADVILVPNLLGLNTYWDALSLFTIGVIVPLFVANRTKVKQPMMVYVFLAQTLILARIVILGH